MTALQFALAALLAAFLAPACASPSDAGETSPSASSEPPDISDVSYGLATNDEGLLTLLDAHPVASPDAAPVITAPADGAELPGLTVFAFQPKVAAANARRSPGVLRRLALELADVFTLERSAHAHGAPMNGEAFLLVFSTPAKPHLLRVFQKEQLFVPSEAEWLQLSGAHERITLTVTRAVFEEGRLTPDGGPFVGSPVHFTIAP